MRRLGLIGCGEIVQRVHAIGYQALHERARVVALADVSAANRDRAGTLFGVSEEQRYSDFRDMLERADIDTVVIATPHVFHADQTVAAAAAGKAIICEKPMAVTLEEADAALAAVVRHGVPYTVVHNLLFTPAVQGAIRLLRGGQVGRPLLGRGEMLGNKTTASTTAATTWRASASMGGGALIDSSYHEIYTVEHLMGSAITCVQAFVTTLKFDIDVDDTALMTFEHENGSASTVQASWCARQPAHPGRWVSVSGERGGVRVIYANPEPLAAFYDAPAGAGTWMPVTAGLAGVDPAIPADMTGHASFLRAAIEAFEAGGVVPVTGDQARHNLAVVEAARQASRERKSVEVP